MATFDDNYRRKLLRLYAEGTVPMTGGVRHVSVRHDDWCAYFQGGHCNCDPEISFIDHATWQSREKNR